MKTCKFALIFSALTLSALGCSHTVKKSDSETPLATSAKAPLALLHHIEISYILGHNLYQYVSDSRENEITIKFSLNHQSVNQRVIPKSASLPDSNQGPENEKPAQKYSLWSSRVQEFMGSRAPASDLTGCRSPFNVTVREGEKVYITRGCRTGVEGTTLSRIARDADFLLYSSK